ncbi:unnamed protein product, partial [Discosporangium mesarthrocarpum]
MPSKLSEQSSIPTTNPPRSKLGVNPLYGSQDLGKSGERKSSRDALQTRKGKERTKATSSQTGAGSPPQRPGSTAASSLQSTPAGSRKNVATTALSVNASGGPALLVPCNLAPVPPPREKKKAPGDVEAGETEAPDAPHKTMMEKLQAYLAKQDLLTRIGLIFVLFILFGVGMGAYVLILLLAIKQQNAKYIAISASITFAFCFIAWK